MKIKLDENGNVVLDENGLPVFIFEEAGQEPTEKGVDVASLFTKIKELNGEAKDHRLGKKELSEKFKSLIDADIKDVDLFLSEAIKNKDTVSNFNEKDYKSAEDVDKIKKGVSDSYDEKIKGLDIVMNELKISTEKSLKSKDLSIRKLLIKGAFDQSEFIRENTVLPPDIAFNTFGEHFDIEEDDKNNLSVYAKDKKGDRIFSLANPGEYADTEEAIELIIKEYPNSNGIIKTSSGGDNNSTSIKGSTGGITNTELAAMNPTERLKHIHKSKRKP